MKLFFINILVIVLAVFTFTSCTNPMKDLDIKVQTNVFKYTAVVEVKSSAGLSLDNATVTLRGKDADRYDSRGSRASAPGRLKPTSSLRARGRTTAPPASGALASARLPCTGTRYRAAARNERRRPARNAFLEPPTSALRRLRPRSRRCR